MFLHSNDDSVLIPGKTSSTTLAMIRLIPVHQWISFLLTAIAWHHQHRDNHHHPRERVPVTAVDFQKVALAETTIRYTTQAFFQLRILRQRGHFGRSQGISFLFVTGSIDSLARLIRSLVPTQGSERRCETNKHMHSSASTSHLPPHIF